MEHLLPTGDSWEKTPVAWIGLKESELWWNLGKDLGCSYPKSMEKWCFYGISWDSNGIGWDTIGNFSRGYPQIIQVRAISYWNPWWRLGKVMMDYQFWGKSPWSPTSWSSNLGNLFGFGTNHFLANSASNSPPHPATATRMGGTSKASSKRSLKDNHSAWRKSNPNLPALW